MKYLLLPLLFFCFTSINGQNFVDEEIDDLAEKIASKMDTKNGLLAKKKRYNVLLVEDFTDTEGNVSKLGASLAEEFSLALSSAGMSFGVTGAKDLAASQPEKKGLNLRTITNGAAKIVDGLTNDYDYEANRRNRNAFQSAEGALDIGASISRNKARYKGIDAVVTGTLTESNDQYRLLIKVVSTTAPAYEMVTNAKGFLSKTPFILALEEEENQRAQQAIADGNEFGGGGTFISKGGGVQDEFNSNNTKVELLEVRQEGQKITCTIRITNTGPDVEFYLYGQNNGGKLIDANNSYDYWATQVQLGEIIDNGRVRKTLVTNNPVIAKVTYGGVARDVSNIAKMTVGAYGHGNFTIEFRDVVVR